MNKIINYQNLNKLSKQLKTSTKVLVGGCFDLLHEGHFVFLKTAKKKGEILLVALESDENIKKIKGNNRPINNQLKRANELSKLDYVDFVILLPKGMTEKVYEDLVLTIKPQTIAITENDPKEINKKRVAESVGARLITVVPYLSNYSTTKILGALRGVDIIKVSEQREENGN